MLQSRILKLSIAAAGAAMLAFASGAALAQSGNQFDDGPSSAPSSPAAPAGGGDLVTGTTLDQILASMERNGFSVELTTDSDGDPMIRSTNPDNTFLVQFYGCKEGTDCTYVNFVKGWDTANGTTLAKVEEWNRTKVWGKAYRDDEKDPWLVMAVNLYGGVSVTNFDDSVDWWKVIVSQFEEHIGWDG